MVIPWDGFSLSKLLDRVEPKSQAKYVAFQTLFDPKRMPNQGRQFLPWPYIEGLRMDEAMHPLTILATGIYGKALPPQDGAPIRLVVPWKYGFKGIKSIVKIRLVDSQPKTTWSEAGPEEYGFYANVNPGVDHPRWSQAHERRIGRDSAPHSDVQWIRRSGGVALRRDGSSRQFLTGGIRYSLDQPMKDSSFAKLVVLVNALVPLAMLSWDGAHHRLGADPTAFITHTTGTLALIFLIASLAMTPLRKLSGSNYFSHFRKLLGLVGFFYVFLHLLTYLSFDRSGQLWTVPADIVKRPFILVGMLAFLLLIPLAATSTSGAIKRLGAKRWKQLHRLAYVAAILGVIHFYLLVKADTTKPIAYGSVLAMLLLLRLVQRPLFPPPQRGRGLGMRPSPRESAF